MSEIESYLATIAANLRGRGARRLAAELHDHVADALADGVAPTELIDRLGPPEEALAAWQAHIRRRRTDSRRRAAFVAFAVATASALGIVQHASGHRPPHPACGAGLPGAASMTASSPGGQVLRGARSGPNGPCQGPSRGR